MSIELLELLVDHLRSSLIVAIADRVHIIAYRPCAIADRTLLMADRPREIADRPLLMADRPSAIADRPLENDDIHLSIDYRNL